MPVVTKKSQERQLASRKPRIRSAFLILTPLSASSSLEGRRPPTLPCWTLLSCSLFPQAACFPPLPTPLQPGPSVLGVGGEQTLGQEPFQLLQRHPFNLLTMCAVAPASLQAVLPQRLLPVWAVLGAQARLLLR